MPIYIGLLFLEPTINLEKEAPHRLSYCISKILCRNTKSRVISFTPRSKYRLQGESSRLNRPADDSPTLYTVSKITHFKERY